MNGTLDGISWHGKSNASIHWSIDARDFIRHADELMTYISFYPVNVECGIFTVDTAGSYQETKKNAVILSEL